jgi:hypothetical protein
MEAADLSRADWRKSSYSAQNGNCVEAASGCLGVAVRDNKDPEGPRLAFTPSVWARFLTSLK